MAMPANEEVARFRQLVGDRLGLTFDEGKQDFLAGVLSRRVSASGLGDTSEYLARLPYSNGAERRALAQELTVGETYFFRNGAQFEALLAIAEEHARAGQTRLRILCAGCASGEEPYTLAMLCAENAARLGPLQFEIVGFDLNAAALARARAAVYSRWSLRQTPPAVVERYFTQEGSSFRLSPAIASRVSLHERNLIEEDFAFWRSGSFDVVFCRNVTMYFAPEVTRAVMDRIRRALAPEGHLFLGHAETLRGLSTGFHLCHTHETFYYRRRNQGPAADERESTSTAPRDGSWMEAIQRASERIARLAAASDDEPPPPPPAAPEKATPSDADGLLLRAVMLTNSGAHEEAESVCTRLLELDELNASAHYLFALCREAAGDRAGAADHDRAAMYLDPSFAMAHLHLGLMARQAHEHEQAARSLAQALLLLPAEDSARVLLLGGGFSRDALVKLCRNELALAKEGA